MKGFETGMMIAVAMFLAIIVLVFNVHFLTSGRLEAEAYGKPIKKVECKTHSDCPSGQLCISINNEPNFCGCLDNSDCLGEDCIYNVCST